MLRATRFVILRDVEANGLKSISLDEKPRRVATLINEKLFNENHALTHNGTVFLEDQMHDWNWKDGKFRYYTRVAKIADVIIVYEEENFTPEAKFDPMTGEKL